MEKTNSKIKQNVMRRVHAVHTMRLIRDIGFSLVVFTGSVYAIGREVWVARIFQNMPSPSDIPAALSFFFSAFLGTHLIVQATILVCALSLVWLAREVLKALHVHTLHLAY